MADKRVEAFRKAQAALVKQANKDQKAGKTKPTDEWHRLNGIANRAHSAVPWWRR